MDYKWGKLNLPNALNIGKYQINYTIVPRGYLAQDSNNLWDLYMFETQKDMIDYFKNKG